MRLLNAFAPCAAIVMVLAACNREPQSDKKPTPDTVVAPAVAPASAVVDTTGSVISTEVLPDAEKVYVDSMMALQVTLPPILDEKAYDTATINSFTRMADLTKGEMKLLASAQLLEKNITEILCKSTTDYADVVFMIDVTGSMGDDIAEVKEGMNQIIDVLREKQGVRLAMATYRDLQHDSSNWFAFRNFETDYKGAKKFVDSIKVDAGGDLPESVYEAFVEVANHHFWRSRTKRVVLIVGDARGKNKAEGGKYDMEDMLRKAGDSRIKVNFFPLIIQPYSETYRKADDRPEPATSTHIIEQVYPNPTSGELHLRFARLARYRIAIYTMTGQLVEDQYIDDSEWLIDMRIHNDGLYVVRVTDDNNQYDVAKFILKR